MPVNPTPNEPRHKKISFCICKKQRRRSAARFTAQLISVFSFRYEDKYNQSSSKIRNFKHLVIFYFVQPGLCRTSAESSLTSFLATRLKCVNVISTHIVHFISIKPWQPFSSKYRLLYNQDQHILKYNKK